MNAFSCSAACLPLLLFGAVSAHAQQPIPTPDHPTATTARTAQTAARLRGTVTDIFGNPVGGAFVAIEGTTLRAITGRTGLYLLEGVPAGRHTVEVHSVGYALARVEVEVRDEAQGTPIEVAPIRLVERTDSLPTVEVIGRKEQSYKNSVSFVGTKTATALKDVPQSVGYVTKELVLDQGASTVNDVAKNISGVAPYSFYNDFSIRGFRATGNRNSGNLLNGMRAQTSLWRQSSLANVERVEVIKGPAATLFGNAAPGGVINRVTKKPLEYNRRSVTLTAGSFNTTRAFADFTGPLNAQASLLYRLNLGYENTDGFRDLQALTTYTVAPSITYVASERTRFNADLMISANNGKIDRGLAVFGDGPLSSRPITASQSAANDYLREKNINLTLGLTHRLAQGLLFNSTYLYSTYDEDMMEHSQDNAYVKLADGSDDPSRVLMRLTKRYRFFRNHSFNNFLTWDVHTGPVAHKLLLGYDYFRTELTPGSSYLEAGGYLLKNGKTARTFDKKKAADYLTDKQGNPLTNVQPFDLNNNSGNLYLDDTKLLYTSKSNNPYRQFSNGLYVQEQLKWNRWQLLLGARMEWFTDVVQKTDGREERTHQHTFIPRVGVVYSLLPALNLYGTWLRGFDPQSAAVQSDPATGGPFDPMTSELWEVGAKGEWLGGRLSTTLSVFRLTQRNELYNAGIAGEPERLTPVGRETSRGIEVDVAGQLLPFWNVAANYAFDVAEITDAPAGTKDLNIQRPGTPKHSGNLWTKFIVPEGPLRHLGIGIGANFVSERLGQVGRRTNVITYPGYALLNAALYYRVHEVQLQLNVNNVLDKHYFIAGYDRLRSFPGAPRNVNLTVTYRF